MMAALNALWGAMPIAGLSQADHVVLAAVDLGPNMTPQYAVLALIIHDFFIVMLLPYLLGTISWG